jgi:orotate phosphoribosyltransferase
MIGSEELSSQIKAQLIKEPFVSCKPSLFNCDTLKEIATTFYTTISKNNLYRCTIGGPTTGAIPIITALMNYDPIKYSKSFYIRTQSKGYNSYIDGCIPTCLDRVVLVDDILGTGRTLLFCAKKLQELNIDIKAFVVLINKEFPGTKERLEKIAPLHSIFSLKELL